MKALIIGFGSIGQKHQQALSSLGITVKVLSRRPACGDYLTLKEALNECYDFAVVATETADHLKVFQALVDNNFKGHIIIEKPLSVRFEELDKFKNVDTDKVWVAYNLRFHPTIIKLKELLYEDDALLYYAHFHVGQLLSTWRKNKDHLLTYSASKALGGGVAHDLSHELDLARWLFGDFHEIIGKIGRYSNITIDSDDLCMVIAQAVKVPLLSINLNYLDTLPTRTIHLTSAKQTIVIDLIQSTIKTNKEVFSYNEGMKNSYLNMWKEVVNICLLHKSNTMCTFSEAKNVQKIISDIYIASDQKDWVNKHAC
jgi:predicted dehydrogenase